jgi:N-acetylglucosaminyldiphosphoundecaprenol N-acetyl-beta-D-mannosaminyltransferase
MTAHAAVGPFEVLDLSQAQVVATMAGAVGAPGATPARAFALHVGGLVARHDTDFVSAMDGAEIVYADGASVVIAAKAAGARNIERAPTTDIGWDLLRELTFERGTPPVVSVVGGPPGLAGRALDILVEAGVATPGVTDHGYHDEWDETLARLAQHPSDVLVVGLGAPREMIWVTEHLHELATGLVLTCGGWLGFLAGEESRAPAWMRTLSLEWAFRLLQSPRRLANRYARGAGATVVLTVTAVLRRWRRRR